MHNLPLIQNEDKDCPLKNRLRKNYRHLRKWANRTSTDCFRLYDRDIKEYPIVIDYYANRFCVQFFSEHRDIEEPRLELQKAVNDALMLLFAIPENEIYWRRRSRRKKIEQYEKRDEKKEFFIVHEHGVKFWVNLQDYLDTGLFLDHRDTRQYVAKLSAGKRLLNLFAYTSAFSVHAAKAGAACTKSVDMSNTYTEWSKENFILNDLSLETNEIVRADCLKFLDHEIARSEKYDLIVVDPPTLSRSKKMSQMFDLQKDHQELLRKALLLLSEGGVIIFSCNARRFNLEPPANSVVEEITSKTIPQDFRNQKIHRCWKILHSQR